MNTPTNNISVNAITAQLFSVIDFYQFALEVYLVKEDKSFPWPEFHQLVQKRILNDNNGNKRFTPVMESAVEGVINGHIRPICQKNWDLIMSFLSCRFDVFTIEYRDYDDFSGIMIDEMMETLDLELFWNLKVDNCDCETEENNN